jgi:hypothetical protein
VGAVGAVFAGVAGAAFIAPVIAGGFAGEDSAVMICVVIGAAGFCSCAGSGGAFGATFCSGVGGASGSTRSDGMMLATTGMICSMACLAGL